MTRTRERCSRRTQADLGYALLLKRYADDPARRDRREIERAAWITVPDVPVLFWSFRVMVGSGFWFIALFALSRSGCSARRSSSGIRWFLRIALLSLPLPWIAVELGWIVAEYGRQPWAIEGVLPTFLAVSTVSAQQRDAVADRLRRSSTRALAVVDAYLMVRMIRRGPEGLGFLAVGSDSRRDGDAA